MLGHLFPDLSKQLEPKEPLCRYWLHDLAWLGLMRSLQFCKPGGIRRLRYNIDMALDHVHLSRGVYKEPAREP